MVPKDSLVLNGSERFVYIVDLDSGVSAAEAGQPLGTVRRVDVSLGVAVEDKIQVRGDLQVGDRVVVVGNERLIPESKVVVVRENEPSGD